jgi:predicted nucleic acid-binding protein
VTVPIPAPAVWLTVDANILVGELLRERGRTLFALPRLRILIAEYTWSEAQTYLPQRVREMRIEDESRSHALLSAALATAATTTRRVPERLYRQHETEAWDRIPRDPDDGHTVAVALRYGTAIWTQDNDFLGCGIATWTTGTLLRHIASGRR